jgi:hypothetical protein
MPKKNKVYKGAITAIRNCAAGAFHPAFNMGRAIFTAVLIFINLPVNSRCAMLREILVRGLSA